MSGLSVRVLGTPSATIAGELVAVKGRRLILLVRLAVAGTANVSTGVLQSDLWAGADATEGAVRVTLTRLRQVIGDSLVRRESGYGLVDVDLDADRFARRIREARDRSTSIEGRLWCYDDALTMWTGRAFEGLDEFDWATREARRLDELREQAIDERVDLQMTIGEHHSVIADLSSDHERDPTRERRTASLALALYRSGRQADALAVIAATRAALLERLGLSVGAAIVELELRILQHDRELAIPPIERRASSSIEVESRLRSSLTMMRVGAFDDAALIVQEGLRIAEAANDRRSRALALLELARLAMLTGNGDPHPLIDEAKEIGRVLHDGQVLARAALMRVGAGVPDDRLAALVELMDPIELLAPDAPERIELLCFASVVVTFIDASDAADRLAEEAERLNKRLGSTRSRIVVNVARSLLGAVKGSPLDETEAMASESFRDAQQVADPQLVIVASLAALRCRYMRGDLIAVDEVLDVLDAASKEALLPFGTIRVRLCQTTNALARGELDRVPALIESTTQVVSRTYVGAGATGAQELLLALELDLLGQFLPLIRSRIASFDHPSAWNAVLALCGDDAAAHELAQLADDVPADDTRDSFVALCAEVAARRGDVQLGRWCAQQLLGRQDQTLMFGLGSGVHGFVAHFDGLARVAVGDLEAAVECFEHAESLARGSGAWLWHAHASIEWAEALARLGGSRRRERAAAMLDCVALSDVAIASPRIRRRVDECRALLGASRSAHP